MRTFKMKNLGNLIYVLSLEISCTKAEINVLQWKYAEDLLSLAHHTNAMDTWPFFDTQLELNDGSPLSNPTLFRKLVGSLL